MPERGRSSLQLLALLALAAGLYLVGNATVHLWDRDEPRYAQCSREMLRGSPEHPGPDFIVPRFLGKPRYAKPPLIYWLQATAMRAFGDTAFAARLPSTVAMLVVLAIVFAAVRKVTGDVERAIWTTLVLATSGLTLAAAKSSLTDAVLLVFITTTQLCAYAIWRGHRSWGLFALLGLAIGFGGLTKGPVAIAMPAVTLAALGLLAAIDWWIDRRNQKREDLRGLEVMSANPPLLPVERGGEGERETTPAVASAFTPNADSDTDTDINTDEQREGASDTATSSADRRSFGPVAIVLKIVLAVGLVVAIVGPWVYLIERREPGFLNTSITTNVIDRIKKGSEGHSAPPGYYLLTVWGTYFPWSIFIPMALVFAWKRRHDPRVRFALAAVAGPFVMLECVQTKLPHYFLPAFPFLAFLTADALVRCFRGEHDDLVRPSFVKFIRGWGIAVAMLGLAPWLLAPKFRPQPWGALVVMSCVAIAYGTTVFLLFRARRPRAGVLAMGLGMAAVVFTTFAVYLPRAEFLRTSIVVADILKQHGVTGAGDVVMQDFKEPSLGFYQGGTIRELSDMTIDPTRTPQWLVTTADVFDVAPDDVRAKFERVGHVRGLAYADGGRAVDVLVLRKLR